MVARSFEMHSMKGQVHTSVTAELDGATDNGDVNPGYAEYCEALQSRVIPVFSLAVKFLVEFSLLKVDALTHSIQR